MQLINNKKPSKNKVNITQLLTVATCTLLGTSAQAEEEKSWEFDTALMYYGETDRVQATELILAGTKTFEDEKTLNLKLTVDALTGASANGAVAQPNVQTFTRPSGKESFNTPANETPLDDTFRDTRLQFNAQWTQPFAEDYRISGGLHLSKEYDYLSVGLNANIARDFNQKNTTLSAGVAYSNDTITPEGDIPTAFAEMVPPGNELNRSGTEDDKTTVDLLLGVTQVIDRQTIMQFNYSYSQVDGYLTDPFKVVSLVNSNGISEKQLYENRPDKRVKNSIFWQTKHHFLSNSIIDFSYRYFWDDWEITSHTVDARYRIPLGDSYIEPHIRYYTQDAAEFYQPFQLSSNPLPSYMSADYRLGKMDGITVGVKYGMPMKNNTELSFRLEFFQQSSKSTGVEEPGVLNEVDLYPSINAVVAQVSYSF
ncbi:DUF3570 domain-containing protein [Colwellia sp. UCD-KL20]|uniref:DUF3570 domain-containing protein n=1 Tax=Colwellia sp. UCD-KL20 TaxID=1917165 RepID=UPI0009706F31|nr:DUF3570 domain-containing protein [Colwellia sp. UCD-KL20]